MTRLATGQARRFRPSQTPREAAAGSPCGKVEALLRQIPALDATIREAESAMVPGQARREWLRLSRASDEASDRIIGIEVRALASPPKTVIDALLIVRLAADYAGLAPDCDMDGEKGKPFKACAAAGRRAADFLAEHHGLDLSFLGTHHTLPAKVKS